MTYPLLPGTPVDLTFEFLAHSAGPGAVDLTFGATLGPPPGTVYPATFNARFALRGSVSVNYNTGQWRGLQTDTVAAHQQAVPRGRYTAAGWQPAEQGKLIAAMPYDAARSTPHTADAAWNAPAQGHRRDKLAWGAAGRATGSTAATSWLYGAKATRQVAAPWAGADHRGRTSGARFGLAKATHHHRDLPWQQARQLQRATTPRMNQAAKAMKPFTVAPWQTALMLASYGGPIYLPPPPVVIPVRPDTLIGMRFCALYPTADHTTLVFGLNPCGNVTPDSPLYILPSRFYMAVHSIEAHLLPSLEPVPIFDVSLNADSGSFGWTFSASGPADLFDALAPTGGLQPSIRVIIDGLQWTFVVDSLQQAAAFGKRTCRLAGRSPTALVGAPYSRETARLNSTARNAQQLAADALALTGVDLDWGITDWLVPAGAWSHTGTPLAAVQAIAQAAGGYVNSHRSDTTLLVRHPYPLLPGGVPGGPWNWGGAFGADVELAPDAIITSSIDRRDGPDLDGVYVSGTAQGVLAHVKRTGTAGAKLAAMVTDPLMTATAAAQQRGLAVLGAAGAKHLVQMSLPVLTGGANPGVLAVGQLVQINHSVPWRGRVRSVGVQAAQPSVRQSISLERHLA